LRAERFRNLLARRIEVRAPMHVVPGNIIHAREADIVCRFEGRSLHDRSVDLVRQAIEHAYASRKETGSPMMVVMMGMRHRSVECRESRTRRSNPRTTARRSRIGKCLARAKDKRDCTERRDQRRFIGHGTHPSAGYWAAFLGR
jgi:hypothetical protein